MTAETPGAPPELRACVDPLHRNEWPVHVGDDPTPIGHLTEHITVTLDGVGAPPPPPRWSLTLYLDDARVSTRPWYSSWREALDAFTVIHRAIEALDALAAERAAGTSS